MNQLTPCSSCDGFLPHPNAACPHCGVSATARTLRRLGGAAASLATAAAFSSTLMACYGPMPAHERPVAPPEPTPSASNAAPTAPPTTGAAPAKTTNH